MATKKTSKRRLVRKTKRAKQEGTPPGGEGVRVSDTPRNAQFHLPAENLSQCAVKKSAEVWAMVDEHGNVLRTLPGAPRDGRQALFYGIEDIPAWDNAARDEAFAIRKRFIHAWMELVLFAKSSLHPEARRILGKTLGRFWATLVTEAQHAESEWNDFTALYYGERFFWKRDREWMKNPDFRAAFDEKTRPLKRGEPRLRAWVCGQLAVLGFEGDRLLWFIREKGRWPTSKENWASPAWNPGTLAKYGELGFELAVLLRPPFDTPMTDWAKGYGLENLWRDLLKPHFEWAWPKFIEEFGHQLRGGRGYKRKDFKHHASSVRKHCKNWFSRWDGLGD